MSKIDWTNLGVIILAAGKGTRLGCTDIPKVMLRLARKPIVSYIVNTLESTGAPKEHVMMVVGFQKQTVEAYFEDTVQYAVQEQQLGTAHAAFVGAQAFGANVETVFVLQGDDTAFLSAQTLERFIEHHFQNKSDFTLLTVTSTDDNLGRVLRDDKGKLLDVLEKEEVRAGQVAITERNTNIFCASRAWLLDVFSRLKKIEEIDEYGIPQLIPAARQELERVSTFQLDADDEFRGINTKEQLAFAEELKHA